MWGVLDRVGKELQRSGFPRRFNKVDDEEWSRGFASKFYFFWFSDFVREFFGRHKQFVEYGRGAEFICQERRLRHSYLGHKVKSY